MADLKQIKIGNTTYNIEPYTAYVPKKYNNRFYPFIGSTHGGTNYKVTLPISGYTSNGTSWMMITMELVLGGSYDGGATGKIFLSYYFLKNSNNVWSADHVRAIGIGNKLADNGVSIQYNIRNPGIFYVHADKNTYNSFSIQNLTANDSASSFDFTTTLIQAVDSIPSELTSIPLTCLDSKGDNKLYVNNTVVSLDGHKHWSICDIGNDTATTFAYSKSGLNYDDYTWLAVWNGYELRSVNKSQFAKADHTHNWDNISSKPITITQRNNDSPVSGAYAYGTHITMRNTNNWFEIYAPHMGTSSSRVYMQTGWDNDRQGWKAIAWTSDIPTSLPASDVYDWAKASTKPTYTKSEVGLGNVDNTADANKRVNYANSAGSVAWGNVTNKPNMNFLYLHSLKISITSGSRYNCRVNILSTNGTKITSNNNFTTVCKEAKNIYQSQIGNTYYWSMPAEGVPSNYENNTTQNNIIFRVFVYFDYSGEQIFYAYYINKTDTKNNFNIINSYANGATFSDTVTTIYGKI